MMKHKKQKKRKVSMAEILFVHLNFDCTETMQGSCIESTITFFKNFMQSPKVLNHV